MVVAGAVGLLFSPLAARAAEQRILRGHLPMEVAGLQAAGRLENTKRLNLAIALPWRNPAALTNLLAQLYDPSSPQFHHWLAPEQFTEAFGPTEADYQQVIAFAKAHGLTVTGTYANRMLVDAAGAVSDIERAFHINLVVYQHPTEARTFFSPDAEPTVDAGLPILGASGLDDFMPPRPMNLVVKRDDTNGIAYATGSGPGGDFLGADLRAAYAPGVGLNGTGQVIGLFEFAPYFANDINLYEIAAHLPTNIVITNVLLDNFTGVPPAGEDDGEETLDIDMAISMAPGATVVVYEGNSAIDILNRMASDGFAKQLSCSFGYYPPPSGQSQVLQQLAAQGQSFFCSSGDGGAYNSSQTIFAPTDDPYCTSVGGTSLTTSGAGGPWQSETTWGGSGGGISPHYPIPSYQQSINMSTNGGSTTLRNIPDVSCLADTVLFWYLKDGQSGTVGGTSASSPMWAGFMALINQQAVANGRGTIGFLNPAASTIGRSSSYTNVFHDIKTGNDENAGSPANFVAVPGYDLATGWGSPNGPGMIDFLAGATDALHITPGTGFATVQPYGTSVTGTNLNLSLTNAGAASLNWALRSAVAWLDVSPTNGTLTPGGGPAAVTVALDAAAVSNLPSGNFLANVWFTNQTSGVVQSRLFSLTVSAANFPIAVTGFNAGVIVPANATTGNKGATGFDIANNIAFYQAGLNANPAVSGSGGTQGLPASGLITSSADGSSVFQLGPYGGNNVLLLGGAKPASGTLALTAPQSYDTLALLASSANGGGSGTLVVHFANGTSTSTFNFNAQDWFNTTSNVALSGFGRLDLGNSGLYTENNGGSNPNLYQTSINLAALGSNQPVSSITFTKPGASGDSGVFALSGALMPPQPAVSRQPQSVTNNVAGSAATFSVTAMGAPPLAFQWYSTNAAAGAAALAGQTAASLVFSPVQSNQAGCYFAVVTNAYGAVTSSIATLTVYTTPQIVRQPAPANLVLFAGETARFSVSAIGAVPLFYSWQTNGAPIPGAVSSNYTLSSLQVANSGAYTVTVSNSLGALTSGVVALTVLAVPATPLVTAIMADQPMGYWRFNEKSGQVAFDYVAGNNGAYTNATLGVAGYNALDTDTAARFGSFSANNSYVGFIAIDFATPSNAAFSLEAWVNGYAQGNDNGLITKGTGAGGEQFNLDTGSGSHAFRFFVRDSGGGAHLANGSIAPNGRWHHLVGVCDEPHGFVCLYVDGASNASATVTSTAGIQSSAIPVSIGSRQSGTASVRDLQFVGTIDDVAIYNKALSAAQVLAHYRAGTNQVVALALSSALSGQLQLNWLWPAGLLQSATDAGGPYTNVTGAASPYSVTPDQTNRFYRLKIPPP